MAFGKKKENKPLEKESAEEVNKELEELIDLKQVTSTDVKKQELNKLYLETQKYLLEQTNIIYMVQRG